MHAHTLTHTKSITSYYRAHKRNSVNLSVYIIVQMIKIIKKLTLLSALLLCLGADCILAGESLRGEREFGYFEEGGRVVPS